MNPLPTIAPIDAEGLELRRQFEHAWLRRMIADIPKEDVSPEQIVKYGQGFCDLLKQDVARAKTANAAPLSPPACRLAAHPSTPQPSDPEQPTPTAESSPVHPSVFSLDPSPSSADRAAYTPADFQTALTRSVRDIYGLPDPKPASDIKPTLPPHSVKPQEPANGLAETPQRLATPIKPRAPAA